jgi:hypothetical protein
MHQGSRVLNELTHEQSGIGWRRDEQPRLTTISLPILSIQDRITVTLDGAGSFDTSRRLEELVDYRLRVRELEVAEKLKWGMLLLGEDIKKEPRVLRETEQVEQGLNDLVDRPERLDTEHPDFPSWTSRILTAFIGRPFESNRTLPELDEDALKSTRAIENATFTPEEIRDMTAKFLGCVLTAKASGGSSPSILGRLDCDTNSIRDAQVTYEISLPEDSPAGWGEVSRSVDDQGFLHFALQAPSPPRTGTHLFRLKATLKWNGGHQR